jgi:hypothetical protein
MNTLIRAAGVLMAIGVAGCQDAVAPTRAALAAPAFDQTGDNGATGVTGNGAFLLAGALNVQFDAYVIQGGDGIAHGTFHQYADEGDGVIVDFDADVTCLSVDAVNRRAWLGGKVTRNGSTDPDFMTDINQPGRDIWFRVLDSSNGPDGGDRSTFLGFEGSAGFPTSAAYCAGRPWAANNARTWPVTSGGIHVHP